MSKKLLNILMPALALSALLAGCGGDPASARGKGADKDNGEKGPAREVRVARAEEGRLARTVAVSGTLAADEQAQLGFKVAGRLERMLVDIGTPVRQGQVVARLAPPAFGPGARQPEPALQQARARRGLPADGANEVVDP